MLPQPCNVWFRGEEAEDERGEGRCGLQKRNARDRRVSELGALGTAFQLNQFRDLVSPFSSIHHFLSTTLSRFGSEVSMGPMAKRRENAVLSALLPNLRTLEQLNSSGCALPSCTSAALFIKLTSGSQRCLDADMRKAVAEIC